MIDRGLSLLVIILCFCPALHAENLEGRPVKRLAFNTSLNLSYEDLSASLPLQVGRVFSQQKLEESVELIRRRGVFEKIEPKTTAVGDGVSVEFVLVPVQVIRDVIVRGNTAFNSREVLRWARIRPGDRCFPEAITAAKKRIKDGYKSQGFYAAEVTADVEETAVERSMRVLFVIDEGYRSKIAEISIEGELPSALQQLPRQLNEKERGKEASQENIKKVKADALAALRAEEYLQALVEVKEEHYSELSGDVSLVLTIVPREPVSLSFEGNKEFSAKKLLSLLNLGERAAPLTANSLRRFAEDIEQFYQRRGYFFARAIPEQRQSENAKRGYIIRIDEGKKYRVKAVAFHGNTTFSSDKLSQEVGVRSSALWPVSRTHPGFFSDSQLEEDDAAIAAFYELHGFKGAKVSHRLEVDEESRNVCIHFEIEEPDLASVRNVRIEWKPENGASAEEKKRINAVLAKELKTGDPLAQDRLQQAANKIREAAYGFGYANTVVDLAADSEKGEVFFVVEPGKKIYFGSIAIAGNSYTHDAVIKRELSFQEGMPWDPNLVEKSQSALYSLGFFRDVAIAPAQGTLSEGVEDVIVTVTERDTGSVDGTATFNTEEGLHLAGELAQRNLFGGGAAVVLGTDAFFKQGEALLDAGTLRAAYAKPRVFDTKVDFTAEGFLQSSIRLFDSFSYDREGTAAILRYPFGEQLRGSVGLTAFNERVYDVPEDIILGPQDQGKTFYSLGTANLELDKRDNAYNPRRGFRTVLGYKLSSPLFGSESNFSGVNLEHSMYTPLNTQLVWANAFRSGYLMPTGDTEVIPLSQRIFLGGRRSLRGFSPNSVGPRGVEGDVAGGDLGVSASTELRYNFTEDVVGLVFLDAGQAFLEKKGAFEGENQNLNDLRFSPGFGIQYLTPIGPISAEVGFALDREWGERWGRINIGIGAAY